MNWSWLAPAVLEFFYDQATPNDYFIGSLSGPGYMYPKAIPPRHLPAVVAEARRLMGVLDLRVFEIMDHSDYWRTDGVDNDLPVDVVDAYYAGLPDAIGFANGYRPGHTFAARDGVPFVSFDYYLSESRDEDEATADLEELASLNASVPTSCSCTCASSPTSTGGAHPVGLGRGVRGGAAGRLHEDGRRRADVHDAVRRVGDASAAN